MQNPIILDSEIETESGGSKNNNNSDKHRTIVDWFRDFTKQWQLQIMTWPWLVFIFIFSYIPMYGILIAFKNYGMLDTFNTAPWVGMANFQQILQDSTFWQSMINTVAIASLKFVVEFPLTVIVAIMIFELGGVWFKKITQTISYLPHFISWIVLGGMVGAWMGSGGLFNSFLSAFGYTANANHMLDPSWYWMISTLSEAWKEIGFGTIMYLAAMAGIDSTLYEAATIDGAGRFRKIWSITLPSIRYMIILQLFFWVPGIIGSNLDQTMSMINSQNFSTANVVGYYTWQMGIKEGNFSYATAVGLGLSVVGAILSLVVYLSTKKLNDGVSIL